MAGLSALFSLQIVIGDYSPHLYTSLMGLFRAILVILFSAIFFYVSHQLLRLSGLGLGTTLGVLLFLAAVFGLVLAMPLYLMTESRTKPAPWHDSLFSASHFALAYINFLATLVILRDIFSFAAEFFISIPPLWLQTAVLYGPSALGLMLLAPLFLILLGTITVRMGPRLKKKKLHFSQLPAAWNGLRILHITDLHIGTTLPLAFVEKLTKLVHATKPDLIVYTGDILDGHAERHLAELELLRSLHPPLGSFYVTGNHEYYWHSDQALKAFRSLGFQVLVNQTATLSRGNDLLQISGVPDPAAISFGMDGPDLRKLQHEFHSHSFRLLLSHQPSLALQASAAGFHLQLSGHTHGGQFFPWNFLIGLFQKYPKGLYKVKDLILYVNQGTGYWGPSLRLGTYCEVTELTLITNSKLSEI
ncbi:MAG: metallophosphoesterase [Bdellovibrio sp.]